MPSVGPLASGTFSSVQMSTSRSYFELHNTWSLTNASLTGERGRLLSLQTCLSAGFRSASLFAAASRSVISARGFLVGLSRRRPLVVSLVLVTEWRGASAHVGCPQWGLRTLRLLYWHRHAAVSEKSALPPSDGVERRTILFELSLHQRRQVRHNLLVDQRIEVLGEHVEEEPVASVGHARQHFEVPGVH